MSQARRLLGVFGANNPTKSAASVTPADFLIGGIIGQFERKFDKAIEINNTRQAEIIFGLHNNAAYYGWDALNSFFQNLAGVSAKLFVKSHVGYTGSAIDAVQGFANLLDGSSANTLKLKAAWQDVTEYGANTNRTGYTITNGFRFETLLAATVAAAATSAQLDSIIGVRVGDLLRFNVTSGPVYKKITAINESTRFVSWTGAFDGSLTGAIGDAVKVLGFQLKTYRKTIGGIVSEVDVELGKIWCTMEPEVTEFYVTNIFKSSNYLAAEDLASVSVLNLSFPVDVASVAYLTSGADGTAPTTAAHWSRDLVAFDTLPVRFMGNPETTNQTIQSAGETYCQSRTDNPKWLFTITADRTKAQLITIGQSLQRSDAHLGILVAHWMQIADPFSTSPIAPPRSVPNLGFVMADWMRSIGLDGIHYIPARKERPLFGAVGIVGDQFLNDQDRTDLSNAGVNVIQFSAGSGFVIRNFFTLSTAEEFQFANGLLMRDFIKVSAVDSLQTSENKPNNFKRITADRMAILNFLHRLWRSGSTGTVPEGETFGQSFGTDGAPTQPADHFEVQADEINNPQTSINNGERNLDVWFTFPAPAGSIRIGVGILLRS